MNELTAADIAAVFLIAYTDFINKYYIFAATIFKTG